MYYLFVFFMLFPAVRPRNFTVETEYRRFLNLSGCYNNTVGFKGSVQYLIHPEKNMSSMVCEWNISVPKDNVVELEFEVFRLPIIDENDCDSYIEISYMTTQNKMNKKRRVCPSDAVERISTGSQEVRILFKSREYRVEHQDDLYGFKINYRAVAVSKPGGNYVFTVILLSFLLATVSILALIYSSHKCSRRKPNRGPNIVPRREVILTPNAPTEAELQTAFELQRHAMQASRIENTYLSFRIFQDRTFSANSEISAGVSFQKHLPTSQQQNFQEKPKISIGPTPRKPLDETYTKWSSKTLRNLRTKLILRFSSRSTSSDTSVFFDAASRTSYSQLSCQGSPDEEPTASVREDEVFQSEVPNPIPSIVVELID